MQQEVIRKRNQEFRESEKSIKYWGGAELPDKIQNAQLNLNFR